jgi:microcystin-dependent protein
MWTFYDRFGRKREALTTTHPVGSVIAYAGSSAPPGWLICNGDEVAKASYPELFSTIGTTYNVNGTAPIGDAANNFRLPDFRGHSPIGAGTPEPGTPGAGAAYVHGSKTGDRLVALGLANIPRHTHGAANPANQNGSLSAAGAIARIGTDGAFSNNLTNGTTANIASLAPDDPTVNKLTAGSEAIITGMTDPGNHSHGAASGATHHLQAYVDVGQDRFDFFKRLGFNTGAASAGTAHTHPQTVEGSKNTGAGDRVLADGFIDAIYLNTSVVGSGAHVHTITQAPHSHIINQTDHFHTISQTNHTHTVIGTTEDGTTAGLGVGSPTHDNVGPVLPTNFIIKF